MTLKVPVKPVNKSAVTNKSNAASRNENADGKASFNPMEYLKGIKQEWTKITWPSREQVIAETGVVILVVTLFAVLIFIVDKIFQVLIDWIT